MAFKVSKPSKQPKLWQEMQFFFSFCVSTLISLINVESRLLILKKKSTLHAHFHPPRLLISQIFSTLHSSFIAVMYQFFPKKIHPPRLLILQLLHPLYVYSNLLGYQRDESTVFSQLCFTVLYKCGHTAHMTELWGSNGRVAHLWIIWLVKKNCFTPQKIFQMDFTRALL